MTINAGRAGGKELTLRIGFDLGGTKMLAAVIDDDNRVIGKGKTKTGRFGNDEIARKTEELIRDAIDDAGVSLGQITALGIAVPGLIDAERGIVLHTPNIGIHNLDLGARIRAAFDTPAHLCNDVNAGLWGEFVHGAARGYRHVVGVFPGTGVGGALILDGGLYLGKSGGAGEIGHITVQSDGRICGCGNYGCLETVASKTALARDLVVLAQSGRSATFAEAGATDIKLVKSGLIKRAIEAGEAPVADVLHNAARLLGVGLAAMVNTFDPELVLLGGGLIEKLSDHIVPVAEQEMRRRAMPNLVGDVVLRTAALGDDAAVVGAADLAARASTGTRG